MEPFKALTVKDLIAGLAAFPQDAVLMGNFPPFNGVKVVPQTGSGLVAIFSDQDGYREVKQAG
jgi:hypothetical protein